MGRVKRRDAYIGVRGGGVEAPYAQPQQHQEGAWTAHAVTGVRRGGSAQPARRRGLRMVCQPWRHLTSGCGSSAFWFSVRCTSVKTCTETNAGEKGKGSETNGVSSAGSVMSSSLDCLTVFFIIIRVDSSGAVTGSRMTQLHCRYGKHIRSLFDEFVSHSRHHLTSITPLTVAGVLVCLCAQCNGSCQGPKHGAGQQ